VGSETNKGEKNQRPSNLQNEEGRGIKNTTSYLESVETMTSALFYASDIFHVRLISQYQNRIDTRLVTN